MIEDIKIRINKKLKCPICEWECEEGEGFNITLKKDFDGDYCMSCWAKQVANTIPKMIEKTLIFNDMKEENKNFESYR